MRNFAVKFCLATAHTEISNESNCVKWNDKFRKNSGIIVQTVRLRIHSAIIGHDRCDVTFSFVPEHSRVEPKSSDLVIYPSHFFQSFFLVSRNDSCRVSRYTWKNKWNYIRKRKLKRKQKGKKKKKGRTAMERDNRVINLGRVFLWARARADRDIITTPIRHPARYIAALFPGRQSRLFVLGVLAFLFTTTAIIHNKYPCCNGIMNDFHGLEGGKKKRRGVRTRETERRCSKRIRPCVPPINREKKSMFLGRNGKELEYIRRYYGERGSKRREKGRGGGRGKKRGGDRRRHRAGRYTVFTWFI